MSAEQLTILVTLGNVFFTPVIVLVTMWVKNSSTKEARREKREDGFIEGLEDRIAALERRLDEKEKEIREIRVELKNRDKEYLTLYQEYTTLKAKYEVLYADHEDLKKQHATMQNELTIFKKDMVKRTEVSVHTVKNLEQSVALENEVNMLPK